MKMTIKVTSEHIAKGLINNCEECPIAQSILEMGFDAIDVNYCTIKFSENDMRSSQYIAPTPDEVSDFMRAFDNSQKVEPFSFELEADKY